MPHDNTAMALTVVEGEVIPWEAARSLEEARLQTVTVAFITARALKILTAPTPPEVIKQRKGPNGKMLDYVPHGWYRARLNEAFGWDWDWVRDDVKIDLEIDTALFFGHLVIRVRNPLTGELLTILTKSGEGGAVIQRYRTDSGKGAIVDLGNDVKSASSEAFKRACLNLGLALDLYWRDEQPDEDGAGQDRAGKQGNRQAASAAPAICVACKKPILDSIDARGKRFTAAAIQKAAEKMFGKALCMNCFRQARAESEEESQSQKSQATAAGDSGVSADRAARAKGDA